MTVRVETRLKSIRIVDTKGELAPPTKSTLRLRGFTRIENEFTAKFGQREEFVTSSIDLLQNVGVPLEFDAATIEIVERRNKARDHLEDSRRLGQVIKEGEIEQSGTGEFLNFLRNSLKRRLLPHQVKAAIHLVNLAHGANFSVPGAGKTAVVLATYEYLRNKGVVTSLFVVGPRSCFMPWQTEFELTLGRKAKFEILAGGEVRERRQKYYPQAEDQIELYLTTYHTLSRDQKHVRRLLQGRNSQAFFVIDEAHYMKQDEGIWASAIAETSIYARKRCVLTGTPFPKSYADGINQFEVLYPNSGIFGPVVSSRIRRASEEGEHNVARSLLEPLIDSLYYRVRKSDLNLSQPVFLPPIQVMMNPIERQLYESIEKRIGELERMSSDRDLETIIKLKKGRQIRRRQATSYSALLLSAINEYDEQLIEPKDEQLNKMIRDYDKLETPGKVERLVQELLNLQSQDNKVVVWANFVGTLHRIKEACDEQGLESKIIYGGTPTEDDIYEDSRETIIEMFKDSNSGLDILIANPAACAESISLHKTCSNAIYYDLSYNCAEYLQSLDRIHRVGGSEEIVSYYRFLQYANTFEHEILGNLTEKAARMADVIDQDFPLAMSELVELGVDEEGFIV